MKDIERFTFFDNLKFGLIVLVIIGHALENSISYEMPRLFYTLIYTFHMPLFLFISGYFSKSKYDSNFLIKKLLIPFFVFNIYDCLIYSVSTHQFVIRFLSTFGPSWFFLTLFTYRILVSYVCKMRYVLLVLISCSLIAGCFDDIGRNLSLSRTIVFFPYFVLGVFISKEQLNKILSYKIVWTFLAISLIVLYVILLPCYPNLVNVVEPTDSYALSGFNKLCGASLRLLSYPVAIVFSLFFMSFFTSRKHLISKLGQRTLPVFALHVLFVYPLISLVPKWNNGLIVQLMIILIPLILSLIVQLMIILIPLILSSILFTKYAQRIYDCLVNSVIGVLGNIFVKK